MTKAELTAENRPACESHGGQRHTVIKGMQQRTKIKVVLRSSLYFCIYSVSYSVVSFVHGVEIELGIIVFDWLKVHP